MPAHVFVELSTDHGQTVDRECVGSLPEALELMGAVVAGEHCTPGVLASVFDLGSCRTVARFGSRESYNTAKPPHPMIPVLNVAAANGRRIWVG